MSELAERAELIVVSPMRRTLQTALLGLDWLVKKGVPLRPDAGWQGMFRSLQFRVRVLFSLHAFFFLVLHFEFHALLWYLRPTCEPTTCFPLSFFASRGRSSPPWRAKVGHTSDGPESRPFVRSACGLFASFYSPLVSASGCVEAGEWPRRPCTPTSRVDPRLFDPPCGAGGIAVRVRWPSDRRVSVLGTYLLLVPAGDLCLELRQFEVSALF